MILKKKNNLDNINGEIVFVEYDSISKISKTFNKQI
ncbi:hypothetical protein BPT24_007 [Tenacibaculum phage pT24]|uniref:Uncharacterized protein n=1 Tax=Tenacibaculum phage pT24 TaxID=1880590 RepID=A0A1B4XWF3_9CAUD|nr:hypothetical protein HYP10_gp007 [Tenacibaculum phage pT24]BAV39129.1 hypothetical protein BPT24_007 [Tenacibaculum phage pT24]